jgi:hypothetical protein
MQFSNDASAYGSEIGPVPLGGQPSSSLARAGQPASARPSPVDCFAGKRLFLMGKAQLFQESSDLLEP